MMTDEKNLGEARAVADVAAIARDAERRAVARCIEIIREQSREFQSEDYAVGQPMSSFNERFACSQCADAIGSAFGMGSDEQRVLVGRPTHIAEYRQHLEQGATAGVIGGKERG